MNWMHRTYKLATKNHPPKKYGFLSNIEQDTLNNQDYRKVIYTTHNCQLVLMNIEPGDEIGEETHDLDQFIRFESGQGEVVLNNFKHKVKNGDAIIVPKRVKHNIINTSNTKPLKLYTVYSPPNHKKNTLQHTKQDEKEEHFNGETDL